MAALLPPRSSRARARQTRRFHGARDGLGRDDSSPGGPAGQLDVENPLLLRFGEGKDCIGRLADDENADDDREERDDLRRGLADLR